MEYAELTCKQTGHGIIINHIASGTTEVIISESDGEQFPVLQSNDFFYAYLRNCGKCEQVKVTSRNGNIFLVERSQDAECFPIGSHFMYDGKSVQAIRAIVLSECYKFDPPLLENKTTRTVSIDNDELNNRIREIIIDIMNL